jgi:putative ABC transport system permease protein
MSGMTFGPMELAMASGLVLLSSGLSLALSLGIHRQILIAALRTALQLLMIGFVLRALFQSASHLLTALLLIAMIAAAAFEVGSRQRRRIAGIWHYMISGAAVSLSTTGIAAFALATLSTSEDWTSPRIIIPVAGIILGTSMNAASVALNSLLGAIATERNAIEAQLALGYTRWQAVSSVMRRAVHAGAIPIINQMAGAGIITLPGIMSGQILVGQDPMAAAQSQIFLMFLLCAASVASIIITVFLSLSRLTDERHRLRLDRLTND